MENNKEQDKSKMFVMMWLLTYGDVILLSSQVSALRLLTGTTINGLDKLVRYVHQVDPPQKKKEAQCALTDYAKTLILNTKHK